MLLLSSERRQPVFVQCQACCCLHPWQLKIPTQGTLSPADAPVWEWSPPHWKFPPACWESSLPRTGLSWLTSSTTRICCNDGKLVVGFKTGLKGCWFWSWSGLSFHPPIPSVPIWRQVGSRLMEHLWEQLRSRIAGMKYERRYVFGTAVGVLELVFVLLSCGCFSPTQVRQPKLHVNDKWHVE